MNSNYRRTPIATITKINWSKAQDQLEFYKVSLFLRDPHETLDLFWFMGEGAVETGWTGVILTRDDLVDFAGKQKASSLQYTQLLHHFTGARIHNFAQNEHYGASTVF